MLGKKSSSFSFAATSWDVLLIHYSLHPQFSFSLPSPHCSPTLHHMPTRFNSGYVLPFIPTLLPLYIEREEVIVFATLKDSPCFSLISHFRRYPSPFLFFCLLPFQIPPLSFHVLAILQFVHCTEGLF